MNVLSPIATGNGAYVLHQQLADRIPGYRIWPYQPWWEVFPVALPMLARASGDLIHATADYGWFFRREGIPLVATVHNYVCDTFMRPYSSRLQYLHYRTDLKFFTRKTLAIADRVVANSRFMIDRVHEDLDTDVPIRLIYNGVDERRFVPAAPSRKWSKGPFRVLFCGNLSRRKRADLLVPLANSLGERFHIFYTAGLAGSRALRETPRPDAAKMSNLGQIAHAEMPEVYHRMDALFMPSVREGFGLCVAEAMACGLPVVAADAGALPELVHHGKGGYLCPIDNLEAYAEALSSVAESERKARNMGEHNRSVVEKKFTLSRMAADYEQLFLETLDAPLATRAI